MAREPIISAPRLRSQGRASIKRVNIETVRDLATFAPEILTRLFGVWGVRLHEFANGIDNSEVVEEYETKSN